MKGLSDRVVLELNKTKIHESTKIRYLGLILDRQLTWKENITELSKSFPGGCHVI